MRKDSTMAANAYAIINSHEFGFEEDDRGDYKAWHEQVESEVLKPKRGRRGNTRRKRK